MIVLGLDCAIKTGWCLWGDDGHKESGVANFKVYQERVRGKISNGGLFVALRNFVFHEMPEAKMVAVEQAHHRGGYATRLCVGMTTAVEVACFQRYLSPPLWIHTLTLKKYATGSGRAEKADMIAAAERLIGRSVEDDNEADAVFIAKWGHEEAVRLGINL